MTFFNSKTLKLYSGAKRVALLAQDNTTRKYYHIFSVIELLPNEIPEYNIPTDEWFKNKTIRSKYSSQSDVYSFYLVVDDLSIKEAVKIFNLPLLNTKVAGQTTNYFNKQFIKEPSGDSPLVLPSNINKEDNLSSILPKRNSGTFVWSQIDNDRVVENFFKAASISTEMKSMSQLTNDWLGFDIWSKSEHIGNIYLSAPNPYFRDIDISLSVEPNGIFYHFKLRTTVKEKLKIRIIDIRGGNVAFDKEYKIKDYLGLIELPHEPHSIEIRVYNSNNDLIYVHGPSVFIKNISVGMSMKHADFRVNVKDNKGNKEFVVEKYTSEKPINIGKSLNFNAPYYFANAESKRKHIALEQNTEFLFFSGGKSELEKSDLKLKAKNTIRGIINRAKEICFLCDPYFNVSDLIEYAFYIENSGVKLKILNAKGSSFIDKAKAKELSEAINEYNSKPFQKIECRMLRGDSILHDRFIVSDSNVWYLGSSFSEFGNRATCIGKVPESTDIQIIKEIEKWYYNDEFTESIEDYSKEIE